MFQYTMWMFVHLTHLVLSSATLSNEICCCSFLSKILLFICVPTTLAKQILFLNHMNRKGTEKMQEANSMFQYSMWMFVHPTYLVLFSATLSIEIFCGSFLSKILLFVCLPQQQNNSKTNFIPQPHEQKSGRRDKHCSSTLCECLCS